MTGKLLVPAMGDSILANFTTKINAGKDNINITNITQTDSTEAKEYLYAQLLKKNPGAKEYMKASNMVYVTTFIKTVANGKKNTRANRYNMQTIICENPINLSNP